MPTNTEPPMKLPRVEGTKFLPMKVPAWGQAGVPDPPTRPCCRQICVIGTAVAHWQQAVAPPLLPQPGSPTEIPLPRHMESGTRNMLAMQCSKPLQAAAACR